MDKEKVNQLAVQLLASDRIDLGFEEDAERMRITYRVPFGRIQGRIYKIKLE
jgi:hypothetical protein